MPTQLEAGQILLLVGLFKDHKRVVTITPCRSRQSTAVVCGK